MTETTKDERDKHRDIDATFEYSELRDFHARVLNDADRCDEMEYDLDLSNDAHREVRARLSEAGVEQPFLCDGVRFLTAQRNEARERNRELEAQHTCSFCGSRSTWHKCGACGRLDLDGAVDGLSRIAALEAAARKVVDSGVLCDPGCCSDDCGCEELRSLCGGNP